MSAEYVAINRRKWDERVPLHLESAFYDVPGFLAGASSLRPFELHELGDVEGLTLIHPQCHFGQDTLSWARRGARVTGLDFSAPAIAAARELSERAGLEAAWIQADVYDAVEAVGGVRHDVVYTGLGAINWLPDIERWARVMAALLAPGGRLYLVEFHPFAAVFGDHDLTVTYPYFHSAPLDFEDSGTYTDLEAPTVHNRSIEWNHPIGSVVSALIGAGLRLEFLHEHDHTVSPGWPFLERVEREVYRLPAGVPALPLMYSLRAVAPAA